MNEFLIGNRMVGDNHPPLVIAEIGINHSGDLNEAMALAEVAINAGAEVIKHQTHIVDDEMSFEAKKIVPPNSNLSIYDIINNCALSEQDEFELMNYVVSRGAIFISTPFSRAAANRLAKFEVPAFKIGSGECNNYPLVRHIAKFGKPIILSTGMNSIESIRPSVEIMRKAKIPFALLHCTNIYPTPHKLVRLNAILELKKEFPDAVVGLSDHTTSNYTSFGAVSLGASILERHFTDNMKRLGPDISSSMDINALQQLIEGSRIIFEALSGDKSALPEESATISFAFASVVAIRDIQPGEVLSEENIWVKRPSGGDFSAREFDELLGKIAKNKLINGYQIKKIDLMP
jgi:N-acetylneuraminate synthase